MRFYGIRSSNGGQFSLIQEVLFLLQHLLSPKAQFPVITAQEGLCLSRTNEDSRVRLRTSSRTIGENGLKPNLNHNPNLNPKPKKRNYGKKL